MKYYFEIQLGWFPGCGWMRSPYGRSTFDEALAEGRQYMHHAHRNNHKMGLRVTQVEESAL